MTTPFQRAVPLPQTFWEAMGRGMRGHCPRCGETRLFRKWLKPIDSCQACGQDWTLQRADDFPPYISIFVTGHLMAPVIIFLALGPQLSTLASSAIVLPLAMAIMLGTLQPAKGAVIAAQWWHGLHGFRRERRHEASPSDAP